VSALRSLRDDYPEDSWIEPPFLLVHLTGQPIRRFRTRGGFERWWVEQRPKQADFDSALSSGLDAAEREDWAAAERAFAEAERAWPERSCSTYNRAVALLRLERPAEAEPLFAALAAREPDEALFHMRRGDALRLLGRTAQALEAYRETAKRGGLEEEVSLRFGLLFAGQGRTEEAVRAFDAAAGKDADAQTLESLADYLESEGIYSLAAHYREEALAKGLESKEEETPDEGEEEGDEERGAVS
jgi:predicted Zn-dependent protease